MVERTQTLRSPNIFFSEVDLTQRQTSPSGVPAGIVGTAEKGPAFVPIMVASFDDFEKNLGSLDHKKFGPYAVNEFLKNRNAVSYVRVLGAGANENSSDINNTQFKGIVKNAGFKVVGSLASSHGAPATELRHAGAVQFLVAKHFLSSSEALGNPVFTDNDSFNSSGLHSTGDTVNLVRAMVMLASGTRMMVLNGNEAVPSSIEDADDVAGLAGTGNAIGKFKLVLSSSNASGFATTDGHAGLKIFTASLNPTSQDYIGKILNKDPELFPEEEHLLYADFAVEDEVATVSYDENSVAVVSGSSLTSGDSGDTSLTFREIFGRFDTRYTTPQTPWIISQPFGKTEYNLFRFETISDGQFANTQVKVSVSNLRASTDDKDPFGTFTVLVRRFNDTDLKPEILEQFAGCTLNPKSEDYVARRVGDTKVYFNFDADSEDERRLVKTGKYSNKSSFVRIIMAPDVEDGAVPQETMPFGFRGLEVLKTSDTLTDSDAPLGSVGISAPSVGRMGGDQADALTGSIVPPIPFRFKVTKGEIKSGVDDSAQFAGTPGINEIVDSRYYWGAKIERVPLTGTVSNSVLNPNISEIPNPLISSYAKFLGIKKLDALVTGSAADAFNNNKFTLARVAFGNTTTQYTDNEMTGSAQEHMKDAVYIRNGQPDPQEYKVGDGVVNNRITMGTLIAQTSSITFNKFTDFAKFTTFFAGGFDGVNILDKDAAKLNDKASSTDTGGGANSSFSSPGLADGSGNGINVAGTAKTNNAVFSYRTAIDIITDPISSDIYLLAVPGVREPFITDRAADRTKDFSLALYTMDIPQYDKDSGRIFDGDGKRPDVAKTSEQFETRAVDNSYSAVYFPDVVIDDEFNNRKVKVPPSIAAMSALAFNDRVSFPWFAPAGFNRASLDFVSNVDVRLNSGDRDTLQDARINPIGPFPQEGFVIFGQKTLKQGRSALDRVNVRRLVIEAKRTIIDVARRLVFEQNTPSTRAKFVKVAQQRLSIIQQQSGLNRFRVVMDDTNNTQNDINENRLNGRIEITPTRAIEGINISFIITNSGVSFDE